MPARTVDENNFVKELLKLRKETYKNISLADYRHLRKIIWTNRTFLTLGFLTAWIIPNPISMLFISLALTNMWCIVTHHVCHGGYDRIAGIPEKYHSRRFAVGWYRYLHWPDWLYPPAWKHEHNTLHHFNTNEPLDPDQVSYRVRSTWLYRKSRNPFSQLIVFLSWVLVITFWKPWYYAPNTIKALIEDKNYTHNTSFTPYRYEIFWRCYLPYVSIHFILLPLLFFPLGWNAVVFVLINRAGAEIITNWHTFLVIVPSHTGEDIELQSHHFSNQAEFYLTQIASTCNYLTGGFWRDYFSGYLNYQIEHHLFPDLPASKYADIQPKVRCLCEKYGINYIQEPLFRRVIKLFEVIQGKKALKQT